MLYKFPHGPSCSLFFPTADEQRSTTDTESGLTPEMRAANTQDSLCPLGLCRLYPHTADAHSAWKGDTGTLDLTVILREWDNYIDRTEKMSRAQINNQN